MSHDEWVSRNGRGRLRIYSDGKLLRFDTISGLLATEYENVLMEYEDTRDGVREGIISERFITWREGTNIILAPRGRRVNQTESLPTRHDIPAPRRNRQPIGIHEDR